MPGAPPPSCRRRSSPGGWHVRGPGDDAHGSTAVTGLELMAALHPPTYDVRDEETGVLRQADDKTPGSLVLLEQDHLSEGGPRSPPATTRSAGSSASWPTSSTSARSGPAPR